MYLGKNTKVCVMRNATRGSWEVTMIEGYNVCNGEISRSCKNGLLKYLGWVEDNENGVRG